MRPHPPKTQHRQRRGSILLLVLGLILLASMLVVAFTRQTVDEIRYSGQFFHQDDLRAEAYSWLEIALATLNEMREIDGALYGPAQEGWNDPAAYSGIEPADGLSVHIQVSDETGRFSLTGLVEEAAGDPLNSRLYYLFEEIGLRARDAEDLIGYLADWTDEDDDLHVSGGAEVDYYEDLDPSIMPANTPVQSWEEFRLIRGFDTIFFEPETGRPTEAYGQFRSAVSLYHGEAVNENSATPLVQTVLYRFDGIDRTPLQQYLAGADGERGTEDDRLVESADESIAPENAQVATDVVRVVVTAQRGEATFQIETIVSWSGSDPSGATGLDADARDQQRREQLGRDERDINAENLTEVRTTEEEAVSYPFVLIQLYENYKI